MDGFEVDHLMAAQRLEKRLEAAVHRAAQHASRNLDLAHARGPLDLPHRRRADEGHLDSLSRWLLDHAAEGNRAGPTRKSVGSPSVYLVPSLTMPKRARRPGNLPAETTSFVGRRRELGELRKKLGVARLVSLVGPGGVGKTRLAIRAATVLARGFRDGAWLVELAEVTDPSLVGNAVVAA